MTVKRTARPTSEASIEGRAAPGTGPRRTRPTYHHGQLREALLDATMDLVAQQGVDRFSLLAAARAVGVSSAAPYRHFESKEALLDAAIERGFGHLQDALGAARDSAPEDALSRLGALGAAYVQFARDRPAAFRLLFHERPGAQGPAGPTTLRVLWDCVADAKQQEAFPSDLNIEDVVRAAWALVHGLATLHLDGTLDAAKLALTPGATQRTIDVFVEGLRRP